MRWLAIVNSTAGHGRAGRRFEVLAKALRARGIRFDVTQTTPSATGAQQAHDAEGHFDGLIAVGGDGTVHEVVNGLSLQSPPLLAVAPYGTGNDWARMLDLPSSADRLASLIQAGRTRPMRVGEVRYGVPGQERRRLFVNGTGLGLDAAVLRQMPSRGPKVLAYLTSTVRTLRQFRARDAVIRCSEHVENGRFLLLYAGIGTHAGGGMVITPHARECPDELALTLVPDLSMSQILSALPALYAGRLTRVRAIRSFHSREVTFDAPAFDLEADGQLLGSGPATVSLRPERLRVIAGTRSAVDNRSPILFASLS